MLTLEQFVTRQEKNITNKIILECTVEPNLKAAELQQAYECLEPLDIVSALFPVGEIGRISDEIFNLAGYGIRITSALHKEVKN